MGAKLEKTLVAGLLCLIVLSTLLYGSVEPWSTFLLEIFIICLLLLWASQVAATGHIALFVPATTYPLLAFLLYGTVQCITWVDAAGTRHGLSADPEATRLTVLMLFLYCVAFLLFANFLVTPERIKSLVNFLIIFGFLLAIFGLLQHFTWNGKFYWVHEKFSRGFGPFHNRNHFAGYLAMLAPLPVATMLLREKKTEKRTLYGFAATLMGVAVVISLSRGGMLSLTASLLLVILLSFNIRREWRTERRLEGRQQTAHRTARINLFAQASAGAIVILAIVAGIFWLDAVSVLERLAGKSGMSVGDKLHDARGTAWQEGFKVFKDNALTGVGLGAYPTVYPTYSNGDSTLLHSETDNDYLQTLTDTGLVGGALLLWFIVLLARDVQRGLRQSDPRFAVIALGCGGGISAMLIHSFFDFNLQIPSNALLFLLLTALAARLGKPASTKRQGVKAAGYPLSA